MSKKHGTVKIAVMGNFNPKQNPANGQTIKTKIITSELSSQFEDVLTVDTSGNKIATLIKTPFLCLKALKRSKNVLILPAQNGLRLIAPILAILNSLFHRKLHYVVIGGWLPQFIKQHKYLIKHLKKFEGIYVETAIMKSSLSEHGFNNIYVMPNCKKLDILSESELVYNNTAPLKLCTFSRVMKQKGIEDAVNAVKAINEKHGKTVFSLDIFGQVDPDQTEWFDNLQQAFPDYITYGGVIPFDKSVELLKTYYALLFPTYYDGEGFAGTLIDAMASGVPVVASDWKYNSEIIENRQTGAIFATQNQKEFIDTLDWVYKNTDEWNSYKINCIKRAKNYLPEIAVKVLTERLA